MYFTCLGKENVLNYSITAYRNFHANNSFYQPWHSTHLFTELLSSKILLYSTNLNLAASCLVTASSCATVTTRLAR